MIATLPTRVRLLKELTPILKTGDMLLRFGDAQHFVKIFGVFGIQVPFSRWAQTLFDTPWSHAAIVLVESDGPHVVDMSDEGLRKFTLQDWLLECHDGGALQVNRVKPELARKVKMIGFYIQQDRERQPKYDYQFTAGDKEYYCTEFTYSNYVKCGVPMPGPKPLSKAPGMGWKFKMVAKFQGLSLDTKVISPKDLQDADAFVAQYLFGGEKD